MKITSPSPRLRSSFAILKGLWRWPWEAQLANEVIDPKQAMKSLLTPRGFDPVLGARPVRRTIQRKIEDQLAGGMCFGARSRVVRS